MAHNKLRNCDICDTQGHISSLHQTKDYEKRYLDYTVNQAALSTIDQEYDSVINNNIGKYQKDTQNRNILNQLDNRNKYIQE